MNRSRFVFAWLFAAVAAPAQQYNISTIAGTGGTAGYAGDGGPAGAAQLSNPNAVAIDSTGNIYISDLGNYVVRKIATGGNISTFAGNNSFGYSGDGGSATSAQISNVNGMAVDAHGNVYLADTQNSVVRICTTDGNISTFAGNGTRGYSGDNGPATAAQLYYPSGVAVDAAGNVYIADYGSAVVRKVNTAGTITTVAGVGFGVLGAATGDGGQARSAILSLPFSVIADSAGNFYIGDLGTGSIRRVAANGVISTVVSNVPAQNFATDRGGAIYYSNYDNSTVVKLLPNGTSLWIAGDGAAGYSGDGGPGTAAQLSAPYGVALDSAGNLYVADSKNDVIRELSPVSNSIDSVANAASNIGFISVGSGNSGSAAAPIAPGEIITLFGAGLGPSTLSLNSPQNGRFGTQLAGVSVSINGKPAPIIYVSAMQIAVVAPYEIDGSSSADIVVTYNGKSSPVTTVPVAANAPGIFTAKATGSGQAAAVNANGTVNGPANPVPLGGFVSLFATGEGDTTPGGVDGLLAPNSPPAPNAPVTVTIGGQPANVAYAGGAPGEIAGLMQINVQIPSNITPGSAVPVVVNVGGVNSQSMVTIAVSAQ